jgi:hypothetical protein
MADFRVWGTIHQIAPDQFLVTVSAVPDDLAALPDGVKVETHTATSRALAVEACSDMVLRMGKLVRARGDRVIDVEAQ